MPVWIFIVDDDDKIKRFPVQKFVRLLREDSNERMPQYAGRSARFVEAVLKLEQRKPVKLLRLLYFTQFFDAEGLLDVAEQANQQRVMLAMRPRYRRMESKLIDAESEFAKRRFRNRYIWKPTQEIEFAIMDAIFGSS